MTRRGATRYRTRVTGSAFHVEWDGGAFHLDHVPATEPRWIGSAADLEAITDRRREREIIELLIGFGEERGESVALFHHDGRLELLTESTTPG